MKAIAKKNCNINGTYYDKGEEIQVANKRQLIRLNELGFIEPMTPKQMQDYFANSNFRKKEEGI